MAAAPLPREEDSKGGTFGTPESGELIEIDCEGEDNETR
jgi:hypothetical protein